FFSHRTDRVKADVGEKDDCRSGKRTAPSLRLEWLPVLSHLRRRNIVKSQTYEEEQHQDLYCHHSGIEVRRFFNTPNQHDSDERYDAERKDVENDREAERVRCGCDN